MPRPSRALAKPCLQLASRATWSHVHRPLPLPLRRLLFPLEGLEEGEPLLVELFDKANFMGIEFLGQVGPRPSNQAAKQSTLHVVLGRVCAGA